MPTPIRVLVAPDKFKGTLSAHAAAHAIADGVRHAATLLGKTVAIDLCPIADGGEGTAEILAQAWDNHARVPDAAATPGQWHRTQVTGPCGKPVVAPWFVTHDARAVFDIASACGLALVPAAQRNPARCTTRGVGELVLHACANANVRELLIGLGGSATVDAGVGMAAALGWRFEDSSGRAVGSPVGADLLRIATIVPPPENAARTSLRAVRIRVLCDVSTGLVGETGCAAVFAPQKGATPIQVRELDAGLRHLAALTGVTPGERDGAAGGLAYGLRAFAGSIHAGASVVLESGAAVVLDGVGFDARAVRADIVLTGEGRFDATSLGGKAVGAVIARSRRLGKSVVVVAGSVDAAHAAAHQGRVVFAPCEGDAAPTDAGEAARRLREATARAVHAWLRR